MGTTWGGAHDRRGHGRWLVLAALLAVSAAPAVNRAWTLLVAAVMILPVGMLAIGVVGEAVVGNLRLWLAIAIACLLPLTSNPRITAGEVR